MNLHAIALLGIRYTKHLIIAIYKNTINKKKLKNFPEIGNKRQKSLKKYHEDIEQVRNELKSSSKKINKKYRPVIKGKTDFAIKFLLKNPNLGK